MRAQHAVLERVYRDLDALLNREPRTLGPLPFDVWEAALRRLENAPAEPAQARLVGPGSGGW